jgi:hypothetical protein
MNRRQFLSNTAAAAYASGRGRAQSADKLQHIAVMTSYFGTRMPDIRDHGAPKVKKDLDLRDFPDMIADHFRIHNVEIQQMYFPADGLTAYLKDFRVRLRKAKSRVTNMPLEFDDQGTPGIISICSPDPKIQQQTIEKTKQWIDHAAFLGSPSVMINQGSKLETGSLGPAIEGVKTVVAYGKSKGIAILVENRGQTKPEVLVDFIKAAGAYSNPDIGNFPDEETRERGLRLLYPLSHGNTHVKIMQERYDFAKVMEIPKEMGFKGYYSIEAGRNLAPDPFQSVQIILDALVRVI